MRGEKGFALVLTLVVTALMVAVAAELVHQVYVDTSLSRGFRDGQQASLLAESGIEGGTKLLQTFLENKTYSSLSDQWAKPFRLDDETGSIEITTEDENGKINLNGLIQQNEEFEPFTLEALKRLGRRLQVPDDVWGALADWLDPNELPRSGGAEAPYYKTLKPPYTPRNGALKTVAELSLVRGFTPEIVALLRPFVTIYAEQPGTLLSRVNINTAPKEVLTALDDRIDDRMAERILEERRLRPFQSVGELSRVDAQLVNLLAARAVTIGGVYRITSVARVKETARTVEAVVLLSGGKRLSWQEY
ncbi:MAG: type II secretion system minor pseudopilin GspK [Deltaproteobacteria bacterium]|nr:type II secretion system minor pseudopilin GspK [Deltaproteobacteria bacterium]